MKKYLIEWETDYCEDYREQFGNLIVEAENEEEAAKQFHGSHAIITNIREVQNGEFQF